MVWKYSEPTYSWLINEGLSLNAVTTNPTSDLQNSFHVLYTFMEIPAAEYKGIIFSILSDARAFPSSYATISLCSLLTLLAVEIPKGSTFPWDIMKKTMLILSLSTWGP